MAPCYKGRMPSRIFSAAMCGFECRLVEVEVEILNGPASITIVGLGDAAVQEAKERLRCAIKNSGAQYPRRKKTINLAPADLPKHGPMFDLPIALGLLVKSEQIPEAALEKTFAVGELGLSGHLRHTAAVLPVVALAASQGFRRALVPSANAAEASLISNIEIIPIAQLSEAIAYLRGEKNIEPVQPQLAEELPPDFAWRFEDVRGHEYAKRALMIAAAGGHNVLLYGPPGSGKTLLARSFQSILPKLSFEESLELTKIYSLAGKLSPGQSLIRTPPFRPIHHTASMISLVGGGTIPRPGEISLSHHGVLFLDELLQFSRTTLDALRQPMEDGIVWVSRVKGSVAFPARFMLMAATNPCPCGYLNDEFKACSCTPSQLQNYRKKLSGPLLDRMDIECYVPRLPFEKFSLESAGDSSEIILKKIQRARQLMTGRHENLLNSRIPSSILKRYCNLAVDAAKLLKDAFKKLHCSGRAYYRILRVARTIADLDGSKEIALHHLAEALQYRPRFNESEEANA